MLLAEVGISVLIICKFSNKWTCTRKKEVEGLSCGFEDFVFLVNNDFDSKGKHFLASYPTFGIQNKQKTKGYACL